jgi:hypothetical protein
MSWSTRHTFDRELFEIEGEDLANCIGRGISRWGVGWVVELRLFAGSTVELENAVDCDVARGETERGDDTARIKCRCEGCVAAMGIDKMEVADGSRAKLVLRRVMGQRVGVEEVTFRGKMRGVEGRWGRRRISSIIRSKK